MVRSKSNWDEDDVRINKSRQFGASNKTRPRTKDRPDYSSAQTATTRARSTRPTFGSGLAAAITIAI